MSYHQWKGMPYEEIKKEFNRHVKNFGCLEDEEYKCIISPWDMIKLVRELMKRYEDEF